MLHSRLLSSVPGLVHGFTTVDHSDDFDRIAAEVGCLGAARAHQIHGAEVLLATAAGPMGEGDAVLTSAPGVLAAVRVADCVPVLLAAPGAVCAVHAGWRGTVQSIVVRALERLCEHAGCSAEDVRAAIGPSIALASYEVGAEVLDAVRSVTDAPVIQGRHVDLKGTNAALLEAHGVTAIDILPHDTFTDPRLHSYRRSGAEAGRQVGFIGLRP